MRNILYFGVYILLAVSISCKQKPKQQNILPVKPFPVIKVLEKDVKDYNSFSAEIKSKNTSEIRPKITGYIKKVLVDEGQKVNKGQLLFVLETNELSEKVLAAKASVEATKVEVDRLKPLVEKNIISIVQLKAAQAKLAQVVANYKSIVANINFSEVRSPISGIVGRINLRTGALASPSSSISLTTISDNTDVYAYFNLNEKEYLSFFTNTEGNTLSEKINHFPPVELELSNGTIYSEKGKLKATTGQIDSNTGTIQFRADFPNTSRLLSTGITGNILVPKEYKKALVIPESSTYEQQGIVYVFKVKEDTLVNTPIEIINRIDNMVLIKNGLKVNDIILAQGVATAKNGLKIIPQEKKLDEFIHIKPIK